MTNLQFKKLQKLITKLEDQAIDEGIDTSSQEFVSLIVELLDKRGFTYEEYEAALTDNDRSKIKVIVDEDIKNIKDDIEKEHEIIRKDIDNMSEDLGEKIKAVDEKDINWTDVKGQPHIPQSSEIQKIAKDEADKVKVPTYQDIKKIVLPLIPPQIDNADEINELKWKIEEDIKAIDKKIDNFKPKEKDWSKELEKLEKDLKIYVDLMAIPKGTVSNKGGRFHGYGDAGSFNDAILDSRYYKKGEIYNKIEVDSMISTENLFDKTGTVISPHTAGDSIEASDHGTAATDQIINVCYGTSDPPAANTTTEGALFIKYTA